LNPKGTHIQKSVAGRRLRGGIVGGGRGSFIGGLHRIAAQLDGEALLVAGALSSDPTIAAESAAAWYLERHYESFAVMAETEAQRADGIDFVIIATPNHLHHAVAEAFLNVGIHVVCDKPLALSVAEGETLAALVDRGKTLFAMTYTYTGYPAVRQAREMIRRGEIGQLRKVMVEYNQSWLMDPIERTGSKQAAWRADPAKSGVSGCVADIGSHAENLLHFTTGERIAALCAELSTFVPGRTLDDDASMLVRLENGGRGTLVCSQIACGEDNNLTLRLYGDKAGLEWQQQDPNSLIYKPAGKPWQALHTGSGYLTEPARAASRIPPGHPEGFLEALAVIYRNFIADIRRLDRGEVPHQDYATVHDGLRGLRFIAAAVESSRAGGRWMML
jgi:predicted dehydrogenase